MNSIKFKTGGHPPISAKGASKWETLFAELDKIEIGVWAQTTFTDEKIARAALVNARKYLKPRKIKVLSAVDVKDDGEAILWIKKVDKLEVK